MVASLGLYALDVYATAKIDQILLEYYGPELYERYTNIYEPQDDKFRLTATTEKDFYGYRSLYGLRILGWLEKAHLAYGAAQEVLNNPKCRKRLGCELKSIPAEDRTWLASNLANIYNNIYDPDDFDFKLGFYKKCAEMFPGCPGLSEYEQKL